MKSAALPLLLMCLSASVLNSEEQPRPNIVIFLADDLGIGDIGCYGNRTLRTPNIDSLARDGMKLTQHLAADSLCTPSRSAFLTGRYTKRYGMDGGSFRMIMFLPSPTGLPPQEMTFAELAGHAGYRTAIIGKWHQGVYNIYRNPVYHPLNQGFDFFYGIPMTLISDFDDKELIVHRIFPNFDTYFASLLFISLLTIWILQRFGIINSRGWIITLAIVLFLVFLYFYISASHNKLLSSVLMQDFETIEMPIRIKGLTKRFADEGSGFIRTQVEEGLPFLLFMSWGHVHTPQVMSKQFVGRTKHGPYGDAVEEMDWGVGEILATLDQLGVADNTLVYFTSDHGGDGTEYTQDGQLVGGYNGQFKGGKFSGGVDGGIRVPGLFRWPDRIPCGTERDAVTSLMDIFPLVSRVTGSELPRDRVIDGKDLLPLLTGSTDGSAHEFLFHYCDGVIHAVRYMPINSKEVWKVSYRFPNFTHPTSAWCHEGICNCRNAIVFDPPLLFDMTSDPGENHPIRIESDPKYGKILATAERQKRDHESGIEPVDSLLTLRKFIWYPHLIQCCNPPFCTCRDEKYSDQELA